MGVVLVNMKKLKQAVCGCLFLKGQGQLIVCGLFTYMWRVKRHIRNSWVVLYFVEALGKESVNWPLPVLAPPSQCIVAACLRHGSHCQRLTTTSLLFPCSGQRATHSHPRYSTRQQRGDELSRQWQESCDSAQSLQVSLYVVRYTVAVFLCVCSCLALRTSAKLGSSITSVAWAC